MGEKWSNFHVTVNTNKLNTPGLLNRFRLAVDAMVSEDWMFHWLKRYTNGAQEDFTDANRDEVRLVRIRAAFEEGGQQNRGLHVHMVIEVTHTSSVQIFGRGVGDVFRSVTGERVNTKCRFIAGNGEDKDFILRYITKEVPTYRPQNPQNAALAHAFENAEYEMDVVGP